MSPEQQRIAIAEACGYPDPRMGEFNRCYAGELPKLEEVPDYLNDRNAMLGAIAKLDSHQGVAFVSNLAKAQGWEYEHSSTFSDSIFSLITATAAQLAEAFLRTLGLWKE